MNNLWCTNYSSVRTNTRFTVSQMKNWYELPSRSNTPLLVGVVWIRTRMSDGIIFYFHSLHVAYFLRLTDYADAQADQRLGCLHATKSSFSQQGTYGMG